jgi:hypothetical protein
VSYTIIAFYMDNPKGRKNLPRSLYGFKIAQRDSGASPGSLFLPVKKDGRESLDAQTTRSNEALLGKAKALGAITFDVKAIFSLDEPPTTKVTVTPPTNYPGKKP